MTDAVPQALIAGLDDPFAQLTGSLADTRKLAFEVIGSAQLTPHMQRIELAAAELSGFSYRPGQDVMLLVAVDGRRPVRRRYTIRYLDRARQVLTIDVVLHGDGPGEQWVRSAQPGGRIEGIGPRGKVFPNVSADWHLFMGDEAAMPAILAMTESLPGDSEATVVIEVPDPADEQELSSPARTRLTWLHRLGGAAGEAKALSAEAGEVELPPGVGHAYLLGEAKVVLALREVLAARGMPADRISPKAYWGRGRANAGHGEPARDA
jgi:NADPH-dependent ferric siderophore reductase